MDYGKLSVLADEARAHSYCIYSGFAVGAALLTKNDKVYTGCNIENASYPAGICAERTAFVKAVSEGVRGFKAIAIAGGMKGEKPDDAYPCGICRQFMNEFVSAADFDVIIVHKDMGYSVHKLSELLPYSFGPEHLNK
ncbi:MAG: cytidine deaminase [Lachnospiraceae bacterium]|nr:cytidine deaminase [Lachnospiraceae bacterium]